MIPGDRWRTGQSAMADSDGRTVEITWTSDGSVDDAVRDAVARAAESLPGLRWFEVLEVRGSIVDGGVARWHVSLRLGAPGDDRSASSCGSVDTKAEAKPTGDDDPARVRAARIASSG